MFEIILIGFFLTVVLSVSITPLVIKLAVKLGAIDKPDKRKIHTNPTPRLGGLGIFISFISSIIIVKNFYPEANLFNLHSQSTLLLLLTALTIVLITGVVDDIKNIKPGQKFFFQLIAASIVYSAGIQISSFTNPFSGELIQLGLVGFPLTVLWITGVTNAFNLIDGLDGLATGISVIAGFTISGISFLHGDLTSVITGLILAGSLIGFLGFNFKPAKIFLGDSGSLFIGFLLAVLSIHSSTKGSTAFSLIIALLALGVPLIDTLIAMLRRILAWFLPGQKIKCSIIKKLYSMFLPDKRHIHHQLLASGFSQQSAVLMLYLISSAFGICAVLISAGSLNASLIIIGLGILIITTMRKLGYKEMALFRNGILLKLYNLTLLRHSVLQIILDTLSIIAASSIAYFLTLSIYEPPLNIPGISEFSAIIGMIIVQFSTFILGGLYKRKIALLGLGDFLHIFRVVIVAVLLTLLLLSLSPIHSEFASINYLMMLNFYFLISMVVGSRILFHALTYLFTRDSKDGKKILIYGADWKGMIALQTLLKSQQENDGTFSQNKNKKIPVGFLDDDPELEGQYINGYPIFGGHWKLEGLIRKGIFDEMMLTKGKTKMEILKRIRKITDKYNVPIQITKINFESLSPNNRITQPDEITIQQNKSLTAKTV